MKLLLLVVNYRSQGVRWSESWEWEWDRVERPLYVYISVSTAPAEEGEICTVAVLLSTLQRLLLASGNGCLIRSLSM